MIKNRSVGLYRDDGSACIRSTSARFMDNLRKDTVKCFKEDGSQITIEINLIQTDFLDIEIDDSLMQILVSYV